MQISLIARRHVTGMFALLLVPLVAFRPAPIATAVAGTATLTYVRPSVAKGANSSGASIFISTARGTNRNTGGGKYLSAARVLNVDTAAMVNGNGSHSGHVTFSEGNSIVVKQFVGTTTTKMVGGRPVSSFKGKWTILRGTGQYAGITGSGTYAGRFETASKYVVDWKGNTSK